MEESHECDIECKRDFPSGPVVKNLQAPQIQALVRELKSHVSQTN